jgi:ABC-2 type transport system permease protein/oleandomycin transport system permease protein
MSSLLIAPQDAMTHARRNVIRYLRLPNILLIGVLQPLILLLLFRYVLGGAVRTGHGSYVEFLVPGVLAMAVVFGSNMAGVGLAEDIVSGTLDRMRALPVQRTSILAGRALSDVLKNSLVLTLVALLGIVIGFDPSTSIGSVVVAAAILLALGFLFAWVSMTAALLTRSPEAAQGIGAIIAIVASFASSGFVPVATMPGWLQTVVKVSPVTHAVDAVRILITPAGGQIGHDVLICAVWTVVVVVATVPLCARLIARLPA